MSVGNAVGAVVGAVIGFYVGGPAGALKGAQLGMTVGGIVDPPKGPSVNGPRLTDLTLQSSSYNSVIPRVYGTVAITGNIIWLENNQLKEVVSTSKSGGKGGGGGSEVTTYSYYATFAVALCKGPITGVRRIWIGPNLVYDAGSSDMATMIASNETASLFSLHTGSNTQLPDVRMQATLGVANTPAYRGLAYIVFNDLALKNYGNTLQGSQVKVEVVKDGTIVEYSKLSLFLEDNPYTGMSVNSMPFAADDTSIYYATPLNDPRIQAGSMSIRKLNVYTNTSSVIRTVDVSGSNWGIGSGKNNNGSITFGSYDWCPGAFNGVSIVRDNSKSEYGFYYSIWDDLYYTVRDNGSMYEYIIGPSSLILSKTYIAPFAINPKGWMCDATDKFVYFGVSYGVILKFNRSSGDFIGYANPPGATVVSVVADNEIYFVSTSSLYVTTDFFTTFTLIASDMDWYVSGVANWPFTVIKIAEKLIALGTSRDGQVRIAIIKYSQNISTTEASLSSVVQQECLLSNLLSAGNIDVTQLTQPVKGYRIGRISALKTALEPLQATWPFDIIQSGYKIKFKPRGATSVVTIPESELGSRQGE